MSDSPHRGTLKIFLGYAAGVGKTYQMLDEAHKMKDEGVDVLLGYFEPHGRKDTIAKAEGLEVIPRRKIEYRGALFGETDVEAILRRNPQVCVIDEFAHTNIPGSQHGKRWQDVRVLLDAGINVLTTMNVQHLESLNDQVWQFTGIRVRETIPDWVVKQADEVVMVDLPPQALLNRLMRGVVYTPEKAQQAMENFFKESTLVALRELAIRQTAHEVDLRQSVQDETQSAETGGEELGSTVSPRARSPECILILITEDPSSAALIRRGKRVADYLQAECLAVCILPDGSLQNIAAAQREAVEKHMKFARNLQLEPSVLQGDDVAQTLVEFARSHKVTQIFIARPQQKKWPLALGHGLVERVVRLAHDIQVTIVAERRR
ncbi:MAG: histidine kinase [Terriglobia bacterium]|jgi:two-component system sensor histidine kinase KdpD